MHLLFLFLPSFFYQITEAVLCGLTFERGFPPRPKRMIIGGNEVVEGVWPWQLSVLKHNETEDSWNWAGCGGTLIGSRWALTAAHCFRTDEIAANYSVLIGSTHASIEEESDEVRIVRRVIRHPTYGKGDVNNDDITLLELEPSSSHSNSIIPVCLAAKTQAIPLDLRAVATGYGASENKDFDRIFKLTTDEKLRQTKLTIHSLFHCGREHHPHYPRFFPRGANLGICTGDTEHGTLRGDSGGPLMMRAIDGRWVQIGLSSYGTYKQLEKPLSTTTLTPTTFVLSTPSTTVAPSTETESSTVSNDPIEGSGDHPIEEGSGESTSSIVEGSGELLTNATYKEYEREKIRYVKNRSSFTKVFKYCGWIEKETKGEVKCLEEEVTFQPPPKFSDSSEEDYH